MAWGIEFGDNELAARISKECFENKLLCETCGSESEVLKLLPPLITDEKTLEEGLFVLKKAIETVLGENN